MTILPAGEGAAKRILGSCGYLWLYEEYLGLFEAAWRLNAGLEPNEPRFQIILGVPPPGHRAGKDAEMARLVLERGEHGGRVLVYCGSHHGFTRYRTALPFEDLYLPAQRPGRMGNRLYTALGDRVAFLRLHAPFAKRWAFFAWLAYRRPMLLPFGGVIDRAHAALGRPVGFDTSVEPFASLEDDVSYYSLHRAGLTLSDFAEGYLVLAPMDERRAVRPFDDLGEPEELDFLRQRYAGTPTADACATAESLRRAVEHEGLFPERAWEATDRAGYDRPQWFPRGRALWAVVLVLAGLLAVRRGWCRRRRRTQARLRRPS